MQRASSIPMTQTPEEKIAALEAELRLEKERALLSQYQYETKELDYQNLLLSHSQILLAYSQTLKDKQEDDRLKFARIEQLQQDLLETQQID